MRTNGSRFIPLQKLIFLFAVLPCIGSLLWTNNAQAGPWGREAGQGLIISGIEYYRAELEGPASSFQQIASSFYGEFGIANEFTLAANFYYVNQFSNASPDPFSGNGFATIELRGQKPIWRGQGTILSLHGGYSAATKIQRASLKRFQDKWTPVIRPETRQNKNLEPGFDANKTEKALNINSTIKRNAALLFGAEWGHTIGEKGEGFFSFETQLRPSLGNDAHSARVNASYGYAFTERSTLLLKSLNDFAISKPETGGLSYDVFRLEGALLYRLTPRYQISLGMGREIGGRNITPGSALQFQLWSEF